MQTVLKVKNTLNLLGLYSLLLKLVKNNNLNTNKP